MKLLALDLIAYGPFTNVALDFSRGEHGLHIVYGPNEAGKTSTLWALRHFLFGFEHLCRGDFLHPSKNLRVGGTVQAGDGTIVRCVRRRGKSGTLRDEHDGQPVDEAALATMLGRLDDEAFWTRFALDHERLTDGGQAILRGGGDVGAMLFAAGAGLAQMNTVRKQLEDEACDLFLPTGKRKLNQALAEFKKRKSDLGDLQLRPADYEQHVQKLQAAEARKAVLTRELTAWRGELEQAQRVEQAVPLVPRYDDRVKQRLELADVRPLLADFAQRRFDAETQLRLGRDKLAQADKTLAQLTEELTSLAAPAPVLAAEPVIQSLRDDLGAFTKAAKDRPGLIDQRAQLQHQLAAQFAALARSLDDPPAPLHPTAPVRLAQLGAQRAKLAAKSEQAQQQWDKARRQFDQLAAQAPSTSTPPPTPAKALNLDAVRQTLRQTAPLVELEERGRRLIGEGELLRRELERGATRLSPWSGTWETLEQAPLPSAATVDEFARQWDRLAQRREQAAQRHAEAAQQLAELDRQAETLQTAGDLPSEADLAAARQRRDEAWRLVRRAWQEGVFDLMEVRALIAAASTADLAEAYELCVVQADDVADRLRQAAARAGQLATLLVERQRQAEAVAKSARESAALDDEQTALATAWQEAWRPAAIAPRSPREMRAWLDQAAGLIAKAAELRRLEHESETCQSRVIEGGRKLAATLDDPSLANDSLAATVDRAEARLRQAEAEQAKRQGDERDRQRLRGEIADWERAAQGAAGELAAWQTEWSQAVAPLELAASASPEEAQAVLSAIQQIHAALDQSRQLESRIAGIDADQRDYAQRVRDAAQACLATNVGAIEGLVGELARKLSDAQRATARGDTLRRQQAQAADQRTAAETMIREETLKLAALCDEAGCQTAADLPAAEERATQRREVDRQLADLEERLLALAGGVSLAEFCTTVRGTELSALQGQRQQLSAQLEQADAERSELDQTIGEQRRILAQMNGNAQAATARQETESLAADIATDAQKYARLRLATIVLREAIERYRQRHQGPVLHWASETFASLTLESFAGLRSSYNDRGEPVLVGVRGDGSEVAVDGMSDGTCDQLYLALRLASLRAHWQTHEPIPFIVDDVLQRFDDDRAIRALKALAQLAETTQVIFFTHHEHLVRLARKHLDDDVVFVQRLDQRTRPAAASRQLVE